jgi:hypothetical protein
MSDAIERVEGPYRGGGQVPLRLCIVCFGTLLADEGDCGRCGSPLLPLEDPEVVSMLREHVRRRAWGRSLRGFVLWSAVCFLLAFVPMLAVAGRSAPLDLAMLPGVFMYSLQIALMLFALAAQALGAWDRRRARTGRPIAARWWHPFVPERLTVAQLLEQSGLSLGERSAPAPTSAASDGESLLTWKWP